MLYDSHIHVGQFYDEYTSPKELSNFMNAVGVDRYAVSSTTVCENNYDKALSEILELISLDGNKVLPIFWITPQMLADDKEGLFLESGVQWACAKIHPELSPYVWDTYEDLNSYLISIVSSLNIPLLLHTGATEGCSPMLFLKMFTKYSHIKFIMAHGRPLEETIFVMRNCENTYVDTAFMPLCNIKALINIGYEDRILWGTDYPIIKHYNKKVNLEQWYKNLLNNAQQKLTHRVFSKITDLNFDTIFKSI